MNFVSQRILRFSIAFGAIWQAHIGFAQDAWGPEQVLRMPAADDSMELHRFVNNLSEVQEPQRSEWLFEALQAGYIPAFLRQLQPIHAVHGGHQLSFWVMSDYLSIGDNDNFLHVPLNGRDALSLAASWNMYLPTRRMVDLIYEQAALVFPAEPQSIDEIKDPMKLWLQHESFMDHELQQMALHSGWLQAGHKKDLVVSPKLIDRSDRAAIYGWQGTDGQPLQGLAISIRHDYSDYSMAARLVAPYCLVDGRWMSLADVLRSPDLAPLLSDEGAWDIDQVLKLDPLPAPPEQQSSKALLVHHQ